MDVWLLRKVCVGGRRRRYGGWWHSRIESLQVLSTLDFGLWTWTWIVTIFSIFYSITSSSIFPFPLTALILESQNCLHCSASEKLWRCLINSHHTLACPTHQREATIVNSWWECRGWWWEDGVQTT